MEHKKKTLKRVLLAVLAIFLIVFINGCFYVFNGQFKSAEKLSQGKELNFYECFSIYTMHTALWMFAWPSSLGAANEVFMMQVCGKRGETVRHKNKYILKSLLTPRVLATMKSLSLGQSKRLAYNGNISYALNDPEHKAAMAINPCVISKEIDKKTGKPMYFIRLDNTWPIHSETHIRVLGSFEIVLNEGLFRYLQDRHIINNFIDEYAYSEEYIKSKF